jgi:hypothetical protein
MIIKPACSREYVSVPNAVVTDRRLSIETRGMVAYLLSRPRDWQIRPMPLAKALSSESKPLGRTKLARMFDEAISVGYLARSREQTHHKDGRWGRYVYIAGMPEDVTAALADIGVATLPQSQNPHTVHPRTVHPHTGKPHADGEPVDKEESPKKQNSTMTNTITNTDPINTYPKAPSANANAPQAADDGLTALGRNALANGMHFAFENSEPFNAWRAFRGPDGMPLIDVRVVGGTRRRGSWFTSLYPPGRGT